jgi:hypothetical protein
MTVDPSRDRYSDGRNPMKAGQYPTMGAPCRRLDAQYPTMDARCRRTNATLPNRP